MIIEKKARISFNELKKQMITLVIDLIVRVWHYIPET